MMHVILYLALLGATTFALPVYNENNHKSLVHQRTSPVDINPIIQTQVFTQTERGPSVSNIVPEEQIREHQPGRIPQNYDKDAKGFLDQSEDEGWRAAENVVVLPFEAMDTNDDGFVNNMELPYLLWSPNEINKALPGYDDDKYVFDDMMLTNAFITDDVSDKVNIPKETYMSIIVHTKPAGDGVKPLNVNPVNNFPDDDNTEEQEHVDYVDREVISEANPAEEEIHQSDMTGKESTFPQSEDPESMDPIDEEDIDETIPAEDEISQPEEGGLIDSMIGKESTFPQPEDPESMDPIDEEDIDEINPAEEGIFQPEEDGLIDSMVGKESTFPQSEEPESMDPVDEEDIDEVNPAEEGIFQPKEGGLIDSMVDQESTFPQSKEPESMDPIDEEDIDETIPAEDEISQPEEGGLIDSMVGKESTFPQSEEPESMDPVDEEDIDELNPAEEGIFQPKEGGLIGSMVDQESTFPQSKESESMDPVDEEDIDETIPAEEGISQPEAGGLIDSMVGQESTFPQSEKPESMDPIDEEDIDETIPAEDEISQPEEGGLIDSMIGKESTFPQSEDPESMDPVDEEDIDEINPAEEGIYQPEEGGLIDSIDETIPTEEKIFQQKEGGLIDSLVGKERTFPESEEPESMDPVDEEAIDEINPVEEGNYQPEEESLIDSMIFFPQLKRITSINADAEEINSNKEGIYHPANYGQITPLLKKDIIFQQSKEMAPKDADEKGSSDEVNFAKENVHREGIDHLVKFIVDKKNVFPQIKKPASDDEEVVQEIKSIKKGNYEQNVGEMTNFEGFPLQKPVVVEEKPETVPEIVSIHDDVVSSNPFTNVSEDMEHKNMV